MPPQRFCAGRTLTDDFNRSEAPVVVRIRLHATSSPGTALAKRWWECDRSCGVSEMEELRARLVGTAEANLRPSGLARFPGLGVDRMGVEYLFEAWSDGIVRPLFRYPPLQMHALALGPYPAKGAYDSCRTSRVLQIARACMRPHAVACTRTFAHNTRLCARRQRVPRKLTRRGM